MLEPKKVLQDRAAAAVELAKKAGADGAWATTSSNRSTSCEVRDGKLEKMQESNSRRLTLELYVKGRYFTHSTSDLRDEQLQEFVTEAVALTQALQPDPHRKLPDPALFEGRIEEGLDPHDASLVDLDPQARIERALEVNARMAGKPKVISASSSFADGSYQYAAASSNGFEGAFGATFVGMYGNVTMQDEGDKRPEDGMGAFARHAKDLPTAEWIGDEALRRANARLGAEKGPTMTATMVVDRQAVSRLIYSLLGPASGRAVQQGQSFWADKLGKKLVSKKLELVDDPHIPRGSGSKPFDGDGIATRKRTVLQDGALRSYFIDVYYANKLGVDPTTGSWSNLVVTPGKGDLNSLVSGVKKGVYVTDWLGGNSDSTSGEFSMGLRGFLIEKGKITRPVGEMNVTGNLLELFSKVAAVGDDTWTLSSVRSPTVVFDGVSFSGA